MTLLLRSLQIIFLSLFRKQLPMIAKLSHSFRVMPIDLDAYLHMNNAKYLNYMEAVRWGLQVRTGFASLALKNGWIAPIARIDIRYFRPLHLFHKFEVSAQIVSFDEKWFYIFHQIHSDGRLCAEALLKSTVRKGREVVNLGPYLLPKDAQHPAPHCEDYVTKWIADMG